MPELHQRWNLLNSGGDAAITSACWEEINALYSEEHRYYHNLSHLEALFGWFDEFRLQLRDPGTVQYAIFYHDLVYVPGRADNELKSAERAAASLRMLRLDAGTIQKVGEYIMATSDHFSVRSQDKDLQYFLDFDLGILSSEIEKYKEYAAQVRKEYSFLPLETYRAGRLNFLQKMLRLANVYFTEQFQNKEMQAKRNFEWETGWLATLD